ncbi:MAG: hypothetical protein J0L75_06930 [Spirochaetes bacterium]|nr:hypothetical protein [Spirochaetota bacterium]
MNSALLPVPKIEDDFYDWHARHAEKCVRVAERKDWQLVCLGDSITHMFELAEQGGPRGKRIWDARLAPRRALNLGFGWDRIQNVLWRLDHGEWEGLSPKLAMVLIGTNNLTGTDRARANTPGEIAEGILAIGEKIRGLSPSTEVLVLGIFPRDTPGSALRKSILETNALLAARVPERSGFHYLDLADAFLEADGTIPPRLLNDGTHPTEAGYRAWAEHLEPYWGRFGIAGEGVG